MQANIKNSLLLALLNQYENFLKCFIERFQWKRNFTENFTQQLSAVTYMLYVLS